MVRTLLALLAIMAAVPFLRAQAPPLIRAEVREVVVDVTVTGRKGVSISDLTAKDFSIWEDGKAQKITSVSSPSDASADPEAAQKHFVIYFDFSTMRVEDRVSSQKFAEGFIDGLASPDRYMAVVAGPVVLQDFTAAKSALKKAIDAPIAVRPQAAGVGLSSSLMAVCDSMAQATGRKALLLFTGGSPASADGYSPVITACNRANVAMYVIAPNASLGVGEMNRQQPVTVMSVMRNPDPQPAAAFAQLLADGTGGQALVFADTLPGQLAAIAREQDEYYRVAYVPPPAKEGSCHSLRVAVNERGLSTRARNEYCTEKRVDLVAGKIAGQSLEARAAGADAATLAATIQLPYFYMGTNRASVRVAVELVPAGMKFDADKSGLHGQIDIVGTALRADGVTAARFADTVNIDMGNRQFADAFTRAPYHYEHQFTIAAGTYVFQIAIGAGPRAVGKVEMPLTIEPWHSASFGIGGIAFSTEASSVQPTSASGGPVLEGRGPLIAGGKQFVPAATNRFQRSGQLYFYTEVYDPALSGANPSALTMQYRILDPKTGNVKADSGIGGIANFIRQGNPVVPFATRLAVAQLPAGSYRLEVRATDPASNATVTRTADFELH